MARGDRMIQAQTERFAAYCKLRDGGVNKVDAWHQIGIQEITGARYERAYRRERGLPLTQGSMGWRSK